MATKKGQGASKNMRDSNPQYLGIKLADGERAQVGAVIVRQRGTKAVPGKNVGMGKDHTLFAVTEGQIKYELKRKVCFNGAKSKVHKVSVIK